MEPFKDDDEVKNVFENLVLLLKEQERRIKQCEENGGHGYRPTGRKWQSKTHRICIDCGKEID